MSEARKGGRPPKSHEEKRSFTVSVRLTEQEYGDLRYEAYQANMKLSIYARQLIAEGKVIAIPQVNKQTWAELGKLGGLMKIFVRQVRSGEVDGLPSNFVDWSNRLFNHLSELRSELKGD